ncbi:hypothetical protein Tco_0072310 [Tanacetum coccineum]
MYDSSSAASVMYDSSSGAFLRSSQEDGNLCYTSSMEWSKATNWLMEKVEDDGELIEDVPRAKRRIILSTHLMQQVFPSPPTTVLSRDATSSYKSVTFYVVRLTLGDACNLVSFHSGSNLLSDKSGESEKTDYHRHSKAVKDCMSLKYVNYALFNCNHFNLQRVMLDTVGAEMHVVKKNEKDLSLQKDDNVILTPHNDQHASFQVCSFMLCDLDFEPLSLSLSSMPSCDLVSFTNILILCLILKASNQSLRKSLSLNLELS